MKRGEERIWIKYPFGLGIRRSNDGLWAECEDGPVYPWFHFKRCPRGFSLILGEYAINFCVA